MRNMESKGKKEKNSYYVTNDQRDDDGCSIVYRQENISTNFRMLALAIFMLFGLCTLLFSWNIVLSNQLTDLHEQVTSLKKTLHKYEAITSSGSDVRRHERRRNRHGSKHNEKAKRNEKTDVRDVLADEDLGVQRFKRSLPRDDDTRLSRPTMQPKKKRGGKKGGGRKRGKDRKKDRCRCKMLPPAQPELPKATAFHVGIKAGAPPFKGQYLRPWDVHSRSYVNQGFHLEQNQLTDPGLNELGKVGVETTGYYYVYGQVVFRPDSPVDVNEKIMIGVTGSTEFVSCITSAPRDLRPQDYVSCHSSGIVHLQQGQVFGIKVSPSDVRIYMSPSHTYFGAFLIGGKQ